MIFNSIFNNIYVLNLKKSLDRKEHIEKEFKRVGIEKYQFFEATTHDSEDVKNLMKSNFVKKFPNCFRCNNKRCNCENNFLTPFQIANWCSFINIFKDIILNDYKFVLICEDDIVFTFQYKRIINKLLSKENFNIYNIDMNKPLLIRLGTAYLDNNHNNTTANPIFLKNYSLCNPCFAINKEMAFVYLRNLKIIDYHSDVYFHKKIPQNIKNIQYFTMYPYPVYELSFVKSKQKFESLIRPSNALRRKEYKEFLLLSSNILLNIFLKNLIKHTRLDIKCENMGYNGNIDNFILLDDFLQEKFFFQYKILIEDNYYDDIKIIQYNIVNKNIHAINLYKFYLNKINSKFSLNLEINDNLDSIILFYRNYLKLFELENIIKININDGNKLLNYIKIDKLNTYIFNYQVYKKLLTEKSVLKNEDIDLIYKKE